MKKKLQVFVSSTYTDLIEERQAAVQAILDAGHIPAGMELFKAGNESQLRTIFRWIDESDVYMLILGGRYGSVEEKSGKSYTQLEYEYALNKNIPIFAVVLSESFLTNKINSLGLANVMEQKFSDNYQDFKSTVMSKVVKKVEDCKDIKLAIHSTLNDFMNTYDLVGWVRGNYIKSNNKSFDSLTKILKSVIIYENLNAYDFFFKYRDQFIHGVSQSYGKTIYNHYSKIYLNNGLLEKSMQNGEEILQLTKLGNEYYNHIILSE